MPKTNTLSINSSIPKKGDTTSSGQSTLVSSFTSSSLFTTISPLSPTSPPFSPCYSLSDSSGGSRSPSSRGDANDDSDASGYDSDATLDVADPASPLKDFSPLRRMSCGYERDILRSLSQSQGGGVAYACACSRGKGASDSHMCRAHVGRQVDENSDYNGATGSMAKSYFVSLEYEEADVNDFGPELAYFHDRDHGLVSKLYRFGYLEKFIHIACPAWRCIKTLSHR